VYRVQWLPRIIFLFILVTDACGVPVCAQQGPIPSIAPQTRASDQVKSLLASGEKSLAQSHYKETLNSAEQARQAAQVIGDLDGQARAQRQRALAMEGLKRNSEAIQAWDLAAIAWRRAQDSPDEVEALGREEMLLARQNPRGIGVLRERALAAIHSESRRLVDLILSLYMNVGLVAIGAQQYDTATWYIEQALTIEKARNPKAQAVAKMLYRLGGNCFQRQQFDRAMQYYQESVLALKQSNFTPADAANFLAETFRAMGDAAYYQVSLVLADSYYQQALEQIRQLPKERPDVAWQTTRILNNAGLVARDRGETALALARFQECVQIRQQLHEASPDKADIALGYALSLDQLGTVTSDPELQWQYYKDSLQLTEKYGPDSAEHALSLLYMGNILVIQQQRIEGESFLRRGITILLEKDPYSFDLAVAMNDLGCSAMARGDSDLATACFKHCLTIYSHFSSRYGELAMCLNNLGRVAYYGGKYREAESFSLRAIDLYRAHHAERSWFACGTLISLGDSALNRAHQYRDQLACLLASRHRPAPASVQRLKASIASNLARAAAYYNQAYEIRDKAAPRSLLTAECIDCLANLALFQGDSLKATDCFMQELAIQNERAPGALLVASTQIELAVTLERQSQIDAAILRCLEAIQIVENQWCKVADVDSRIWLACHYGDAYRELVRLYVLSKQYGQAFLTAERGRGRSLADSLFERNSPDAQDVPSRLLEQQGELNTQQERNLAELTKLDPVKDRDALDKNRARLAMLALLQQELREEIRTASPRYANLRYPQPVTLADVQQALDPGTLLMEYMLDQDDNRLYLFTMTRNGRVQLHTIPIKKEALLKMLARMYAGISDEGATRDNRLAVELYNLLLRPAQNEIKGAKRLLICPDEILYKLPFSALVDNNSPMHPHYLVQSKPLHFVESINVYAELRQSRQQMLKPLYTLMTFGIPTLPQTSGKTARDPFAAASARGVNTAQVEQQNFVRLGGDLADLSNMTKPVREITGLYGKEALTFIGDQSTKKRVFAEAPGARALLFVCHGLLDNTDPLNSRLALTPENPDDDGMLRAIDVIHNLKLNADLVVLCGCQTGLGKEMGMEGVVGLTRAFEYAGAKSVLVSLWKIDATGSVELLNRFFRYLHSGKSKDEALRLAQIDLITGKCLDLRDPLYWAAFSLQGDWR
jgi:CHAT domain-containing protein